MKKPKLDDYELFYMEIPQADYLNDIEISSDEAQEAPSYNKTPTLSDEQVSALARDQLGGAVPSPAELEADQPQDTLFSGPLSD